MKNVLIFSQYSNNTHLYDMVVLLNPELIEKMRGAIRTTFYTLVADTPLLPCSVYQKLQRSVSSATRIFSPDLVEGRDFNKV